MSDFIRALGMKLSHGGKCRKCGRLRSEGSHQKCNRWPVKHGCAVGFHYEANSEETTIEELNRVVSALSYGEDPSTPVRFSLNIMQVFKDEQKQNKKTSQSKDFGVSQNQVGSRD
jgi:hypothetical protein